MKITKILTCFVIPSVLLTGCSKKVITQQDVDITMAQTIAKQECYKGLKDTKVDLSKLSADQLMAYSAVEKLGEANKIIAGKSLDPCADAGGTNVYDAEIASAKENTKQTEHWLGFGESVITKGIYGWIASEAFDWLKVKDSAPQVQPTQTTYSFENQGGGTMTVTDSFNKSSSADWTQTSSWSNSNSSTIGQ